MKKFLQIMLLLSCVGVISISARGAKLAAGKTAKQNSAVMTYSFVNNTSANIGLTFFPSVPAGATTASALTGTSTVTTTANAIIQVAPMTTSNVMVSGTPVTFSAGVVNSKTGALQTPVTTTIGSNAVFTVTGKSSRNGKVVSQLVVVGSVAA